MALGTATVASGQPGAAANAPVRFDKLSFKGDGTYAAGGTADFQAYVRAALGQQVTVLQVLTHLGESSGYFLTYDTANDKLMVFFGNYDASDGPLIEDTTADQSARDYVVTVISY